MIILFIHSETSAVAHFMPGKGMHEELYATRMKQTYVSKWNNSTCHWFRPLHYTDVIMTAVASQVTSLTVVYSTVYSDADQRKHQSSASLAFVRRIHRDRWIPRTKGQLRGKCFHLMTSSWTNLQGHIELIHMQHNSTLQIYILLVICFMTFLKGP